VPANRITMRRIREVLRLKHECALSNAQIAAALGIAKGSVANYLAAATVAGLTHSEAQALDDAALNARLQPQRYVYPQFAVPDFGEIHRELRRKGVTLQLLWEEYRAQAQSVPYSRSRFCERYIEFRQLLRRSMRQIHVAGEKLFVDYAGPTVPLIDAYSGEITRAHICVAVWGASNYTYARRGRPAHVRCLPRRGDPRQRTIRDARRRLELQPGAMETDHRTTDRSSDQRGCAGRLRFMEPWARSRAFAIARASLRADCRVVTADTQRTLPLSVASSLASVPPRDRDGHRNGELGLVETCCVICVEASEAGIRIRRLGHAEAPCRPQRRSPSAKSSVPPPRRRPLQRTPGRTCRS
jgi:hypothetical protein